MSETAVAAGRGPLVGIRVLDLTRLLPGPVATMHLADLGADVIKIEDPGPGDYARTMRTASEERQGDSVFFRTVNRNKRGLVLDLKQASGVEVFHRLAAEADVIVESFRPGVVEKLGIGYTTIAALNPKIVYCSISGYGQSGPWRDRAGHDLNYIAVSGVLDRCGHRGGPPAIPNLQIGDLLGGALTATTGILAALVEARGTGRGRWVDVGMAEAALAHNLFPFFDCESETGARERGGDELSGRDPWYGVYKTRDGLWLAVGALEFKFWKRFCEAIGRPDLTVRHGVVGDEARRLREEIDELIATRTRDDWLRALDGADCCVTPVLSPAEALTHEQFMARGMVVEAEGGRYLAPPVRLSGWDFSVARPAPRPGEHSEAVLREFGFGLEEIQALAAAAVI